MVSRFEARCDRGLYFAGLLRAAAGREPVVRDGVASFLYHPSLGLQPLPQIITGIHAAG